MARILLIGYNPPQLLKDVKIEAAHYRTWQFLQPLLKDGHSVCLCAGARGESVPTTALPDEWRNQVTYCPIALGQRGWLNQLQAAHDSFAPDCIVVVNFFQCLYATRLKTHKPIWMDLYGDIFTLVQTANFRTKTDRGLQTIAHYIKDILIAGDAFSGCSTLQKHALVGQLGLSGRLNRHTFGFDLAHVILPGAPPIPTHMPQRSPGRDFLSQFGISPSDFVVLWCGGYNTWTDVDTLFRGLQMAMAESPKIHYVSVGASTYAGPDTMYDQFCTRVQQLPQTDAKRFHLLGWRPWAEVGQFYLESDVGINIDALHYETLYGTRTRLVEMIAGGLPVVTTLGSELSDLLYAHQAALTFAVGDWHGLGQQLMLLANDAQRRDDMARAGYAYAAGDLSFATTTQPLRQWVQDPKTAPDKLPENRITLRRKTEYFARTTLRQLLWRVTGADS
jgi:glycosyltransferase involved in cell wall biosynthesis